MVSETLEEGEAYSDEKTLEGEAADCDEITLEEDDRPQHWHQNFLSMGESYNTTASGRRWTSSKRWSKI